MEQCHCMGVAKGWALELAEGKEVVKSEVGELGDHMALVVVVGERGDHRELMMVYELALDVEAEEAAESHHMALDGMERSVERLLGAV